MKGPGLWVLCLCKVQTPQTSLWPCVSACACVRLQLVNGRFELIQKMLSIWSSQQNHHHIARLDVIIVWLIVLEVIMAAFEVAGYFFHR